jgi:ankyrin repeat protein
MASLRSKSFASAELLLAAGADIEYRCAGDGSDNDVTPLGKAVDDHNLDAARFLIEAKADINNRSGSGMFAPLSKAILKDNLDMIKLILSYGPDLSVIDIKGWTCLHTAAVGQQVGLEAQKQDIAKDRFAENRASEDCLSLVKMLIEAKADLETKNLDSMTPLIVASAFNNVSAIKALVAVGADLEASSDSDCGCNALTYAMNEGHVNVVRALIEAKADVEITGTGAFDGYTPIMSPMLPKARAEIVHMLYDAGANLNHMIEERTVLDIAYSHVAHPGCRCVGPPEMYRDLGAATWEEVMVEGSELAKEALEGNTFGVLMLIPKASVDEKERALVLAARVGDADMVRALLAVETNPSCRRGGTTPLLLAARGNHTEVVGELLKAGADIGATVRDETAMKRAMKHKNRDMIQLLYNKSKELKNANKQ